MGGDGDGGSGCHLVVCAGDDECVFPYAVGEVDGVL